MLKTQVQYMFDDCIFEWDFSVICTSVSRDMIKNELKRNLTIYVEHRGSNRNGGYYLKSKDDK